METKERKIDLANSMGISKSTLYYKAKQPAKDWATKVMIEKALRIHNAYGHKNLARHLKINKKRVLRVMKLFGIKPYKRKTPKWKPKKATGEDCPNLLLTHTPSYPNHIWASDFTYLWFDGAWLYVATVLDIYTRKIVGITFSRSHDRWMVMRALLDALRNHPRPEIIHSDHGSEYKSKDYQGLVKEVGIKMSMAAKGCPWENGYQESFYSGFKLELGDPARFNSLGELTANIYRQICYYNNSRIHSALRKVPAAFARQCVMLDVLE